MKIYTNVVKNVDSDSAADEANTSTLLDASFICVWINVNMY